MTNVLREKDKAVIRPGLSAVLDYAGLGAGLIPFNGQLITLFGDTVYDFIAAIGGGGGGGGVGVSGGAAVDLTSVGGTAVALSYPAWSSGYTYPTGTFVTYGGYTWYSLVDGNIGNTPEVGAFWGSLNPPVPGSDYTLVSGSLEGIFGYAVGAIGSMTPDAFSGATINGFYSTNNTFFTLSGSHAQNVFTSIVANGITLTSVGADVFTDSGTDTTWEWYSTSVFADTNTYPVTIA